MSIDPAGRDQVATALLEYLSAALPTAGEIAYAEAPQLLEDGTDTFVYGCRVGGTRLAEPWLKPIVLRLFRSEADAERAAREVAAQRFASGHGYRTPEVLAFEPDCRQFGLPFVLMQRAPGVNLLAAVRKKPFRALSFAHAMADIHASLHQLPVAGAPLAAYRPLVERRLAILGDRMRESDVQHAGEAYDWLTEHRSAVLQEELSLCHNDFHPLNIVVDDVGGCMVIDWSRAELGDRLHDVARTHVILTLAQGGGRTAGEKMLLTISGIFAGRYLSAYRRSLPFDALRLRYWLALLTFQSWVETAPMMSLGAEATGARAGAVSGYRRDIVSKIRLEFWKRAHEFDARAG